MPMVDTSLLTRHMVDTTRNDHTQYRLGSVALGQGDMASGLRLVNVGTATPVSPSQGDLWLDTNVTQMAWKTYYGATTGWQQPWNLPWGFLAGSQVSDGTQANIGTVLTDIISVTANVVANRRYHVSATTNMYSPAGAPNYQMFLYIAGTQVEQSEELPNTTYGRAVHIHNYRYEPVANGSITFLIKAQFTTAAGIMLYDLTRFRRLIIEDIGPNGNPPAS